MKHKYILLLLLLTLPLLVSFAPDWVPFTSTEQAFSARFPATPQQSEQSVKTDAGELSLKIFAYEPDSADANLVYMVMTTEYPVSSKISSDAKEHLPTMFRNAVDGGVKNVNGTLLAEKDLKLKGYPGREYRISYQNGTALIIGKMYLVKNRMYMIQIITTKGNEDNSAMQKFLNSFRLLDV